MISAKVICDSLSPAGKRLTTFELRYPKFIHGELMTHRVLSRNASSSRAVPTAKLIEEVRSDAQRATFVWWGKNEPGMSANTELEGDQLAYVKDTWREAALEAAHAAECMVVLGAHKQLVNRLLEPFSHINVVVSATEWDNFFGLRLDKAAQPEMRQLAVQMLEAMNASSLEVKAGGEWHLPYIDNAAWEDIDEWNLEREQAGRPTDLNVAAQELGVSVGLLLAIRVSVARCARVSYRSFETGKISEIEEDLILYRRLMGAQPIHASPAEHQACAEPFSTMTAHGNGNFVGWQQYRKMLPNEAVAPLPEGFKL